MDPHVNMHENLVADVDEAEILKLHSRVSTLEKRSHLSDGPR